MIIKLPAGLRIKVTNNNNLTCPIGTKATVLCDEELDTEAFSSNVFVMIDGDSMTSALPFKQCEIIVEPNHD